MNTRELERLRMQEHLEAGQLSVAQTDEVLKLPKGHVRRLPGAYRKEGATALVHENRVRKHRHTMSESK